MNNTPQRLRKKWDKDPKPVCARYLDGNCQGRMTKEHALIFAGKQVQADWAILDLCAYHHAVDEFQDGGDLNKEKNIWIALCRATDEELKSISKAVDYPRMRDVLTKKYTLSTPKV